MSDLSGWRQQRIGDFAAKVQDGTHFSPTTTKGPYRYLTSKNIRMGRVDLRDCGWIDESEHREIYRRCDPKRGDLLLTKDGANTGNVVVNPLDEEFSLLSSVAMIRCDESISHGRYLYHVLAAASGRQQIEAAMVGNAISRLTLEKISDLRFQVPPLCEQRRIAEVLDTIDETIQATERVIAKLETARVGLRETLCGAAGSPIRRFKLCEIVEAVVDCPHSTPEYLESGVLVARTMHIKNGAFLEQNASRVSEESYRDRIARMPPRPGDVVLTREAPVGEAFAIPRDMRICLGQRVVLIRPGPDLLGPYLVQLVYSSQGQHQIRRLSAGTTNPHLNVDDIRELAVAVPSLEEQGAALDSLTAASEQIDAERARLGKMRDLRAGLASDLLSGRVRTVAA